MKFQFWIWFNVILLLLGDKNALAQSEALKINSIDQVWEIAFRNNPQRQIYTYNNEKVETDYKASRAFLLPTISGNFIGQDNLKLAVTPVPGELVGKPNTTFYAQFGKQFTYNAGITATKTLLDVQSILASRSAKNSVLQQRADADAFDQQLKQQTAHYYYGTIIAKRSVEISKQDQQYSDSVVQLVQLRLKEGLTDSTSLNQALINFNNARFGYIQNKLVYQQCITNLIYWMGLPNGTTFDFTEDLTTPPGLLDGNLGDNKSLTTFEYQIKGANLNVQTLRSAFAPKLTLSSYFGKQQYSNDFGMSLSNGSWNDYRYLSLNLDVPIFTGFRNRNRLASAKISKRISELQFKDAKNSYAAADSITQHSLGYHIQMANTLANNYNLYFQLFKLNQKKFKQGLISLDVLLKSFEDYLSAENSYFNNYSNVYSDYAVFLSRK